MRPRARQPRRELVGRYIFRLARFPHEEVDQGEFEGGSRERAESREQEKRGRRRKSSRPESKKNFNLVHLLPFFWTPTTNKNKNRQPLSATEPSTTSSGSSSTPAPAAAAATTVIPDNWQVKYLYDGDCPMCRTLRNLSLIHI